MVIVAVAGHFRTDVGREQLEEFPLVRMATLLVFGVQDSAIDAELVDTFAPCDELVTLNDMLVVREHILGRAHGAF